jgi:hypothetical protein
MYEPGEIRIAPRGCQSDENGYCDNELHDHPTDARTDYKPAYGAVFLPHSCEEWVIGGPEQIRALIHDLEAALVILGGAKP